MMPALRPAATYGRAFSSIKMSETAEAVAGVNEVSDQEQRSLQKTRTNKRGPKNDKNKKPLTDFKVGDTVKGKVVSIMTYGAFVDIGTTTDGLVHVSQLANDFVQSVENVVKVGDEVEVRVLSLDLDNNKVSLTMRAEGATRGPAKDGKEGGQPRAPRTDKPRKQGGDKPARKELPDEFKNFDDKVFIPGKIASVMDYGVFVSLNDDVDALVHVSEISEERNIQPEKMFKVGQEVQVRIVQYDKAKKRLSLSMKPWVEAAPKEEDDDVKSYRDPVPEGQKSAFQMAWEMAQAKQKATA